MDFLPLEVMFRPAGAKHDLSVIQPLAERYFIFLSVSVFALYERKNRNT